jgi:hypothetical protein
MMESTDKKDTLQPKAYCSFCGSPVGLESDRTGEIVTTVYDCPKCDRNYCDQCSYSDTVAGERIQKCLRCDSALDHLQ